MSTYNAIHDLSETLRRLLADRLNRPGQTVTVDVATDEASATYTLEAEATLATGCFDAGGEEKAAPKSFVGKGNGAAGASGAGGTAGTSGLGSPALGGRVGGGFDCALASGPSNDGSRAPVLLAAFALGLCTARRRRRAV